MELTDRLESSAKTYKIRIDELKHAIDSDSMNSRYSLDSIVDVMKNQEKTFMILAHRTENLQYLVMNKLSEVAQLRKKYFNDDSLVKYIATRYSRSKSDDRGHPTLEQMALEILIPVSSLPRQ